MGPRGFDPPGSLADEPAVLLRSRTGLDGGCQRARRTLSRRRAGSRGSRTAFVGKRHDLPALPRRRRAARISPRTVGCLAYSRSGGAHGAVRVHGTGCRRNAYPNSAYRLSTPSSLRTKPRSTDLISSPGCPGNRRGAAPVHTHPSPRRYFRAMDIRDRFAHARESRRVRSVASSRNSAVPSGESGCPRGSARANVGRACAGARGPIRNGGRSRQSGIAFRAPGSTPWTLERVGWPRPRCYWRRPAARAWIPGRPSSGCNPSPRNAVSATRHGIGTRLRAGRSTNACASGSAT